MGRLRCLWCSGHTHREGCRAGLSGLAVGRAAPCRHGTPLLEPRRQFFLDLFFEVLVAGKVHAAFLALFLEHGAVGHLPFYVADENPLPFCTQAPLGGMA